MCSGRVDLSFIIRALAKGADGVMIGACWPGECHYVTEGNYHALANTHLCRKLLERIGIRPERLRLEWLAASEGTRFAEIVSDYVGQMAELGPLGRAEGLDDTALKTGLEAAGRLIPYVKLVEREKLRAPTRTEEAYNEYYRSDEVNRLFDELVADKLEAARILLLLSGGSLSLPEISEKAGLSSSAVTRHMKSSLKQGLVAYDLEQGRYSLVETRVSGAGHRNDQRIVRTDHGHG